MYIISIFKSRKVLEWIWSLVFPDLTGLKEDITSWKGNTYTSVEDSNKIYSNTSTFDQSRITKFLWGAILFATFLPKHKVNLDFLFDTQLLFFIHMYMKISKYSSCDTKRIREMSSHQYFTLYILSIYPSACKQTAETTYTEPLSGFP